MKSFKVVIVALTILASQMAWSKKMVCYSGFQKVVLLEGGYAQILGFDYAGFPSQVLWKCGGVAQNNFGWFSTVEHVCQAPNNAIVKLYTSTVGSVVTVQLTNSLGLPVFNGPCALQDK